MSAKRCLVIAILIHYSFCKNCRVQDLSQIIKQAVSTATACLLYDG